MTLREENKRLRELLRAFCVAVELDEQEDRDMMEIDELIHRHELETAEACKAGKLDADHAVRQVKQLIGHARYLELQRDSLKAHLRDAIYCCVGKVDPGTLESWKKAIGLPPGASIHDYPANSLLDRRDPPSATGKAAQ